MEVAEHPPFDSGCGGFESVPQSVLMRDFGNSRIEEILMLSDVLAEPPAKGQRFQRLPKHMRRRQMSRNSMRMPLEVRKAMSEQMSNLAPTKRPSRKYRRKPRHLISEYARRQRSHVWLETHVWHAKRFHMTERWGYKLPVRPTNKAFRVNYRATSQHCLLLDLSYFNCIELIGTTSDILAGLQSCTSPACGLTFAARTFLDGSREGALAFYHPNQYPRGFVGNISFLWEPCDSDTKRKFWLWVHPAFHQEIVDILIKVFGLSIEASAVEDGPVAVSREMAVLSEKNVPFIRVPEFKSSHIVMHLLKDTLNRFRLIGPLSTCVLTDALVPAPLNVPSDSSLEQAAKRVKVEVDDVIFIQEKVAVNKLNEWLNDVYENTTWSDNLVKQKEAMDMIKNLSSPSQLPARCVLSFLAVDPRVTRPKRRTKSVQQPQENIASKLSDCWNPGLAQSPLWDDSVRDKCSVLKPTTSEINEALSQMVLTDNVDYATSAFVPLLILQNPGCGTSNRLGYGSGFDVIVPAGWGIPVWHSFILRNARPGGLREVNLLNLEARNLWNTLPPDSKSGQEESERLAKERRACHLALPPAKRPNFKKLGIPAPFKAFWGSLAQFWSKDVLPSSESMVLRDRSILQQLSDILLSKSSLGPDIVFPDNWESYIVPVSLVCLSGCPQKLAHIYIPTDEDLNTFKKAKTKSGKAPIGPEEPHHIDNRCCDRKELIANHRKLVRREKRKRKKQNKLLKDEVNSQPLGTLLPEELLIKPKNVKAEFCVQFKEKLDDLWLPKEEEALEVMKSNSRKQAGYVTIGDFGFREGQSAALGYITGPALVHILRENLGPNLLFRNVDQFFYRYSTFKIIIS